MISSPRPDRSELPQTDAARGTLPQYYFQALLLGLACIAAWEFAGLDVPLAQLSFNALSQSFEWRQHWLLTKVLHSAIKYVLVALTLGVLVLACLPQRERSRFYFFAHAPRRCVFALFFMLLATPLCVSLLKSQSLPFCPWDELPFGGAAPQYQWWEPLFTSFAGKFGRCWPAGHASAGFGMVGAYFYARLYAPRYAMQVLVLALFLGVLMGGAQQIRGAHFMSHTLWTAWFAWAVCGLLAPTLKMGALPRARL